MSIYVTHARTPEELRAEICSDLQRRLAFIDGQIKIIARSATDKAKLAAVQNELASQLHYWTEIQIVTPPKRVRTNIPKDGRTVGSIAGELQPPHASRSMDENERG